jgi:hypothetical protein
MKTIKKLNLTIGDKWNDHRVVIDVAPEYVVTAELFENGKPKRSTVLLHGENTYSKYKLPKGAVK